MVLHVVGNSPHDVGITHLTFALINVSFKNVIKGFTLVH